MRRTALALLLLGGPGPPALAAQQPMHTVHGVVRDTALVPLAGVEVILLSPRRSTLTDAAGRFRLDGVPTGPRHFLIRRIGYLAVHPSFRVPQPDGDTLHAILLPLPTAQSLPALIVESQRPGIRGVVGDTGYHALPGALVELLGTPRVDTTDARGHFGFEDLAQRQYLLRISRSGYGTRFLSVNLGRRGQEYSIFLDRLGPRSRDWGSSREGTLALEDLGHRLALEFRRTRLTRTQLIRYGSLPLCDVKAIEVQGPWILIRGSGLSLAPDLCNWSADEVELVEWGRDYCREAAGTIKAALADEWCAAGHPVSFGNSNLKLPARGWVVIWPRN